MEFSLQIKFYRKNYDFVEFKVDFIFMENMDGKLTFGYFQTKQYIDFLRKRKIQLDQYNFCFVDLFRWN